MKPKRPLVIRRVILAAALLLGSATPAAFAASRQACTPRPAQGGVASQTPDARSVSLDAAHPVAIANWDASGWQRHRIWISLEASNAGDSAAQVMPQMVIDARPDGGANTGLFGLALVLAPHARATQRLAIYLPDDAKTLGVRAFAALPAQPVTVAFALECSDARFDPGEFAPAIAASLDEAVKTYFNGLVDPLSDPRAVLDTVRTLSAGAQDASDVVWTLRGVMQAAHDDHSFILGPGETPPARRRLVTRSADFEMHDDAIAVVRLHALDTTAEADALAWATALHDGIAALAARHPRAWLVDLRDHDGDSPWPSFAGLSTLLGGPAVGAFVRRGDRQDWIADRGVSRIAGGPARVDVQAPPEPSFDGPVAVLIGPDTRNAGEDVAVAFRGRPRTRFFGAPTAGFPILGIAVHRLSDGTTLGVLETRDADRQGIIQREPVAPDTLLKPDALAEALPSEPVAWVLDERQPGSSAR